MLPALIYTKQTKGQDAILSQFFAVPVYINPAFAGTHKGIEAVIDFRDHPLADVTNISAFNGSVDAFFPEWNAGLGLIATSSYMGNMVWTNNISAVYSYHLQVNASWHATLGAQAGYYRRDYRWSNLDFLENGQPPPQQKWKHAPDFGAGFLLYNKMFYGGAAAHHLTRPNIGLYIDSKVDLKLTAHMGAYFESEFYMANSGPYHYFLSPNVIYQKQGPFERINYGMYAGWQSIMAGAWYRQDLKGSNTLIFLVGLQFGSFRMGYSYDHSFSGFTDRFHGVNEISISYFFERKGPYQPIRCPRF